MKLSLFNNNIYIIKLQIFLNIYEQKMNMFYKTQIN